MKLMRLKGPLATMWMFACLAGTAATHATPKPADALFEQGQEAYRRSEYRMAAERFRAAAALRPAAGTLRNLGNAEWQRGRVGSALLAWEQSLWLAPLNRATEGNLRFARQAAQIEAPELAWYEVVSSWLPADVWAWLTGGSLWLAVGMTVLPGVLRLRRAAWHQGIAAAGLAVFLLSLPAHLGIETRSRLGFILTRETPLRLTPTREAQFLARLPSGEPARLVRMQGEFLLVRTARATGWVQKGSFGTICPRE